MKRREKNPSTFPTVITGRAKMNSTILGQKLEYEKIRETYWVDVAEPFDFRLHWLYPETNKISNLSLVISFFQF